MNAIDLFAARDHAAVTRTYALALHARALRLAVRTPLLAGMLCQAAEVASELADEADDDAEALAMFLGAMREVTGL